MTDISPYHLQEIAEAADQLPEKYQVAAFQELLRHHLGGDEPMGRGRKKADDGALEDEGSLPNRPAWFASVLKKMPEMHRFASGNRDAQAAWALVELYRRGEPVTPTTARVLVKDELGISPEARQHMSKRLGDFTPKYATRVKSGQGYRYEPTVNIVEKFPNKDGTE